MTDQLPGGAPAFEEPDFSKIAGASDHLGVDDGASGDDPLSPDDQPIGSDDEFEDASEDDDAAVEEGAEVARHEGDLAGEKDTGALGAGDREPDGNTSEGAQARAVLEHLAVSIVDDKEAVTIETKQVRGQLRFYLHVAPGDMGRIIGRRGRTAQALRTIVRAAAASESDDVFVEIVD
ncbi:MAG: KH domain-containing protein [Acidimicrobiales bacterium]